MKKSIIIFLVIVVVATAIVLGSLPTINSVLREIAIDRTRPESASMIPDFSGNISDIRITGVEREFKVSNPAFENHTPVQIYYGYKSDDIWYDIPCENYELRGVLGNYSELNYEAAGQSHIVRIGPYLLVSICAFNVSRDENCVISDTLGTEVITPLEEYYTPFIVTDTSRPLYSYLKEDRAFIGASKSQCQLLAPFDRYYFLIVEMDKLTEDYQINITFSNGTDQVEDIIKMDEIRYLLNKPADN